MLSRVLASCASGALCYYLFGPFGLFIAVCFVVHDFVLHLEAQEETARYHATIKEDTREKQSLTEDK